MLNLLFCVIAITVLIIVLILYINNASSKSGLQNDINLFSVLPFEEKAKIIYNAERGLLNSASDDRTIARYRQDCAKSTDCIAALDKMEHTGTISSKFNVQRRIDPSTSSTTT